MADLTPTPGASAPPTDQFTSELDQLIDRHRGKPGMTYGSIIGALHLTIHDLCMEAAEMIKGGGG
jgi:hypothetical protein